MKSIIRITSFSTLLFLTSSSFALDFFAGIDGMRSTVEVGDVRYHPLLARVRVGAFFKPGIGFELNYADTAKADEEVGLEATIESHYAALIRLQSPLDGGLSAYVNLGYSVSDLVITNLGDDSKIVEDLRSPFASIGFQKQMNAFPRISYFGEYDRLFRDDNVAMTSFSFGYQFNF